MNLLPRKAGLQNGHQICCLIVSQLALSNVVGVFDKYFTGSLVNFVIGILIKVNYLVCQLKFLVKLQYASIYLLPELVNCYSLI